MLRFPITGTETTFGIITVYSKHQQGKFQCVFYSASDRGTEPMHAGAPTPQTSVLPHKRPSGSYEFDTEEHTTQLLNSGRVTGSMYNIWVWLINKALFTNIKSWVSKNFNAIPNIL